ncbi:MAG: ABC transporter substrate-binding protein [Thauera sp.]|nr:ABC transporter substrate-binding protein [Thauera sp.]
MKPLRTSCLIALAVIAPLLHPLPAAAQQGVAPDSVTLGYSGARTGPVAELAGEFLSGATLYFDALNARGGVNGRRILVNAVDDAYDPNRAADNVRKLVGSGQIFALFGNSGTATTQKAIPIATAAHVPFFAPHTGADALREHNAYVFHLRASYGQEIEKIVEHLTTLGVTSIGVVHHADPFGLGGLAAASRALAKRGLAAAVVAPIASNGADAADSAKRIATANPAAVIMITAGNSSAAFLKALQQTGQQPMTYGLSVISSKQLIRELGEKAHGLVIAQVVPTPFRVDYPVVREYRQAADKAGQAYSHTALEGYVAARTLSEALRRAGRELSREKLVSALEEMRDVDIGGLRLSFSARDHVGMDFVDLTVISRGSFAK